VTFPGIDIPVQCGFGHLKRPANFRDGMPFLIEILGNTELFAGEDFGSAAFPSSGSSWQQACGCPLPDQVSLKLHKSAEDMENEVSSAGCRINVFRQAFKANAPLLKRSHASNEMGEGAPQAV
jgi:hypothetical protein